MKKVYFDTNVFDHIHKELRVDEGNIRAVRFAIEKGRISILFSSLNLEEAYSALESSHELALSELRLILSLTDWQRPVKPPHLLLNDDIKSYAQGEFSAEPFMGSDPIIESKFRSLQNPNQHDTDELYPFIKETRRQKEAFKSSMTKNMNQIRSYVKGKGIQPPSFKKYYEGLAGRIVEDFAKRVGFLEACKRRGIEGLLQVKSVRMAVGITISLLYAQTFEKTTPQLGDPRDIMHAISATAGDIFVTQDRKFTRLLSRIPIEDFEVINLNSLFARIQ